VAIRSKYLFQTHPKVETEDLSTLPHRLERDFWEIYQLILKVDPYRCGGFPNHALKGRLKGYRALEIDWNGVAYRLVYRVYEKPSPRRVLIISFAEHDPAYDKAIARLNK